MEVLPWHLQLASFFSSTASRALRSSFWAVTRSICSSWNREYSSSSMSRRIAATSGSMMELLHVTYVPYDCSVTTVELEYVKLHTNGNLSIPRNIVRPRGNVACRLKIILGALLITVSLFITGRTGVVEKVLFVGFHSITILLTLIALECCRRCCLLFEEIKHLDTKYGGDFSKLLCNYCFEFKVRVYVASLTGAMCVVLILMETTIKPMEMHDSDFVAFLLILSGVWVLEEFLQLQTGKLYDSLNIKKMNGLDYGSSMAHSYFHGYLKIMLPPDGYTSENLKDLMLKYENDNNIAFQMHKLYILVPLSLHCPKSLKSESSPSILESKTLDSIKRDRGGVKYRDYKNAVYKIMYPGVSDPVYVSAEYATPLLTFKEAISHNNEHARHYKEHQSEIIWNFYNTTTALLNADPECRHLCELIFYDDKAANGGYVDVGLMLTKKVLKDRKMSQMRNFM